MAIPDAVIAQLRAMQDGPMVLDHPFVETWYDNAAAQVNSRPWGTLYTQAVALVTAHCCLSFPSAAAHIDRTPVKSVPASGGGSTTYMDVDVNNGLDYSTTDPGRRYLTLRRQMLGVGTPFVI